jgi:hypothetical protein
MLGRILYAEEKGNAFMRLQERTKPIRTPDRQVMSREVSRVLKTATWDERTQIFQE